MALTEMAPQLSRLLPMWQIPVRASKSGSTANDAKAIYKTIIIYFFAVLLVFPIGVAYAINEPQQKISEEEARQLVYEVVKIHNPDAELTSTPRDDDPDFYFFAASWPNPVGSPMIGYFAVNPWTGDVWDGGCRRLKSPSLKKHQASIRKRFRFNKKNYQKLRAKTPIC